MTPTDQSREPNRSLVNLVVARITARGIRVLHKDVTDDQENESDSRAGNTSSQCQLC